MEMDPEPAHRRRSTRTAANEATARLAAVAAREISPETPSGPSDELLREALTTNTTTDLDNWKAWVEIESEPAFFSGLLRDLGVQDIKVAEMFGVSMEDVQLLPQPILGFVFLCRYANEDTEVSEDPPPSDGLWFANQTMPNGCATVALLNILMNKPAVQLGANLGEFKSLTAPLPPLLRGYLLEGNQSLRRVHNSYARCMEHLNADLLLANEFDENGGWPDEGLPTTTTTAKKPTSTTKKRKSPTTNSHPTKKPAKSSSSSSAAAAASSRPRRPRRRRADEDACHYKAFVHVAGQVWVLDGLEAKPVSLGPADADTWVRVAVEDIAHRIAVAGDMVNVLAVCESPHPALRRELCSNIQTLSAVYASMPEASRPELDPERLFFKPPSTTNATPGGNESLVAIDVGALEQFHIALAQLQETAPRQPTTANNTTSESLSERMDLLHLLQTEQARIFSEYRQVDREIAHEQELCSGRKRDYGSVVHVWARKLAERGELQGLIG